MLVPCEFTVKTSAGLGGWANVTLEELADAVTVPKPQPGCVQLYVPERRKQPYPGATVGDIVGDSVGDGVGEEAGGKLTPGLMVFTN